MDLFYRLNPRMDSRSHAASMFDVASCMNMKLITGGSWGDDYLVAPVEEEERKLVEELLHGDGIFFERVSELPIDLRWKL